MNVPLPGKEPAAGAAPGKDGEHAARTQIRNEIEREQARLPGAFSKYRAVGRRGLLWGVTATILLVCAVLTWRLMSGFDFGLAAGLSRLGVLQAMRSITPASWGLLALLLVLALALAISFRVNKGLRRRITQLGQYNLMEKLSEGPTCTLYLASHALLRRPTAIKLFKGDQVDADALARFEKEVQLTSELTHPNTVQVYDYGRTPDGVFYYAMEYLPGIDLEQLVRLEKTVPRRGWSTSFGRCAPP